MNATSVALDPIDYRGAVPFFLLHLACLAVFWVGVSPVALGVFLATLVLRMFGLTAGYHRYFSHRSYKTSRAFQMVLALLGVASLQMGPLWWAAHHRHHHRNADTDQDIHSPKEGFWWSHMGWIVRRRFYPENIESRVPDLAKFSELVWLNRHPYAVPLALAALLFAFGVFLEATRPELGTNGAQLLIWGFVLSTIVLYHCTFMVNSVAHIFGSRRFDTPDLSRNNLWVALLTMGEGWHNNHHRYPGSERQGFYWWEIDLTHTILKGLSWMRIVWDLRSPPKGILASLMVLFLVSLSLGLAPAFAGAGLPLRGEGTLKFLGMQVYTAALYTGETEQGEDILAAIPKVLSIRYHRAIDRHVIVNAAQKNLKSNPAVDFNSIAARVEQMAACYESVQKGDVYELEYAPGRGTRLLLNGDLKTEIPGDDFAAAYFGIWLGERPIHPKLREQLLGRGRRMNG
ncbi:MAG: chalcone isomerase family protein [Candidatus Omnitrophica bacterium]|nr:chalcone isomerase family protein [Candidatus Omnitrophota bacterium]